MSDLHHVKLTGTRCGCMYATLYALTGEEEFLREHYLRDVNAVRHALNALAKGWLIDTLFTNPNDVADEGVWEWLYEQRPPERGNYLPLLVSVDSLYTEGERHMVAMYLDWEGIVWVSDSNQEEIISFDNFDDFLESHYALAYEIQQLVRADLDAHPYIDGVEYLDKKKGDDVGPPPR